MKAVIHFIRYWLPPLALMGVIFYLSSRQSIGVSQEESINFIIFKTLHVLEYALLTFLLFRALYKTETWKLSLTQSLTWAAILAFTYGVSDEIHQTFVPTRTGSVRDIFIDLIGICGMVLYTKYRISFIKRFLF